MTKKTEIEAEAITSHDVAKGAGTTLLARLGAVVEVVAQPVYVWLFGLAGYGLYAALWAAITLTETIADLGMTTALQRTVPQAKSEAEAVAALRAAFLFGVGPSLVVAAFASLFAADLALVFNAAAADAARLASTISVFAWALPLWAFVEVSTSALRARRVFGAEIRLRLFWEQIVRLAVATLFWLASFGTSSLIYAHIASLIVICLLCVRLLARNYDLSQLLSAPAFGPTARDTLKAGLSVMPVNLVGRFFSDAPTLALNALLPGAQGAIAGGQFTLARKISSIVQTIRIAFAYVLSPLASAASVGGNGAVRHIYGFATRVSLAVALPVSAVMIAGGPTILDAIGRDMGTAYLALSILLVARLIEAITGAAAPIQQVTSRYVHQSVGSIVGVLLAALLAVVLLPEAGLTGMALAVALGLIATSSIPLWQLNVQDGIHPCEAPFASVAAKALFVSAIGFISGTACNLLPPAWVITPLALILLVTLWTCCRIALPRQDREALGNTGRKLRLA